MIENHHTHALEPFDFSHLLENVPKIKMLDYDIENYQFSSPLDSSAMTPDHWSDIARVVEENYDDYDGFVVLHGTDTMAYTASALSFMLENLDKPVVITGSQLPIGDVRTDGEENLIASLQIAAAKDEEGKPMIREVVILFENSLWRGNRSTKRSAENFDAFCSNNYPMLARIGLEINYNKEALWRSNGKEKLKVHHSMNTHVMYIDLFPGIREDVVCSLLKTPGIKGVVLRTFGAGNGPTSKWFLTAIRDAVARGLIIVNVTQCVNGSVHPLRYLTGLELAAAGVISGHDITAEAAVTKLMYLLGQKLPADEIRRLMGTPLRGEMSC